MKPMPFSAALLALAFVATPFTAYAGTLEDRDLIFASCKSDLGMNDLQCTCITEKAEADLSDEQHAIFANLITDPTTAAQKLSATGLGSDKMIELMNFMTTAPTLCQ